MVFNFVPLIFDLKKLIYTKLMQMLWAIHRAWPFFDSCSRTRFTVQKAVTFFNVPPLLFCEPNVQPNNLAATKMVT
jgi:hypothetical protein